jgi:hypothetical protein
MMSLGTAVTNEICIYEQVKSGLNLGNVCYREVYILLFKKVKTTVLFFLYGCKT